jgi:AraC-like DNA-binding protein
VHGTIDFLRLVRKFFMSLINKSSQEIVEALEMYVLPALREAILPQVYLEFPLQVPPPVRLERITQRVLPPGRSQLFGPPASQHWPRHTLITHSCACLNFVVDGEICERTALTAERAEKLKANHVKANAGLHYLYMKAPGTIYYPTGVPHSDGTLPMCENGKENTANYRLLWFHIFRTEIIVRLSRKKNGVTSGTKGLQIADRKICLLFQLYAELLESTRLSSQQTSAAALLTIMLALHDRLLKSSVPEANMNWPQLPRANGAKNTNTRQYQLCEETLHFVQLNLHQNLTLQRIASHSGVSAQHLNLAFHQVFNTTVMRYLTHQRLETARRMMKTEPWLSLKEIAARCGFASAASFNNAFVREMHCSPGEYRRHIEVIEPYSHSVSS